MPTYPIQFRRDTPENWQSANPVLRQGEMGIELPGVVGENGVEIFTFKIGDGVRPWNDLPYASGPAGPSPEFEWSGTSIRFKNPDGTWGKYINIQGPQGIKGEQGDPGPAGEAVPATTTSIGGVIVGDGLEVTEEGCISVSNEYISMFSMSQLEIGVPRPWRSTTLPPNYCWANGDFVAFADWPELKAVYEAGGFAGLLMAWDADGETQAANLGQWRPDAAQPTGLYTPNLTGQFLRCWGPGAEEDAGAWHRDEIRNITGNFGSSFCRTGVDVSYAAPTGAFNMPASGYRVVLSNTTSLGVNGIDASLVVPTGAQNVPQHIWQPVIIYLGQPAAN